jgi:S-adenosylmethionine hydrolase
MEAKETPKIITLTTDFGLKDPYVAEMKAVILSISPDAIIVDVTHEVPHFNIRMGAYTLASAVPYFPEGAVHVAVVDPGVGTRRRPIIVQANHGFLVGPDNGLLILAAKPQEITCIREITNTQLMLSKVSSTFHGRDIFAPAAAHLANGVAPAEFGSEIPDAVQPEFAEVTLREGVLSGEVLHVDSFGNVITNMSSKEVVRSNLAGMVTVEVANQKIKLMFCDAYGEAALKEPLVLIGSHGYLEIAVNQGNAAEKLNVKAGDKVKVS